MNNVLYINKPKGISSFDICYKLRKVLNTKRIGHTGTLDPNATGVMIILYNESTKASQFLVSDTKEYRARVIYGIETDTLDIDGNIIKKSEYISPSKEELGKVLSKFLGKSKQQVPFTSAKKINGKKLYEYQMQGKEIELPIIDINVYEICLEDVYDDGFSFTCLVSSGTYIRALARDILKELNIIGTVYDLCRTKIDSISLDDCDDLDKVLNGEYKEHNLLDLLSKRYMTYEIMNVDDVKNGKRIKINSEEDKVLLVNKGKLLAVYKKVNDEYRCVRGLW